MTINIIDKQLPVPLLPNILQQQGGTTPVEEKRGLFKGKLDTYLAEAARTAPVTQATAETLAQSFHLQMLRSTMKLAVDGTAEEMPASLLDNQSTIMQSLIKKYAENLPKEQQAVPSVPAQPLPEPAAVVPLTSAVERPPIEKGSQWLDPIIEKASRRYGVDVSLIRAVIKAESNFNPNAVSHAGARGLMQLMPATARSLGVNDSFDPEQNVMAGTRFLGDLLNRYNGDLDSALAAYNWGPGNVDKRPDRLPRETREYLVNVKRLYSSYS
jgi:soluble lytic murein transglycosylase-like protein